MADFAQIFVVAGIVEHHEKYLITQRYPNDRFAPDLWEFPGGKLNFGEAPTAALERELMEEMGIEVHKISLFRIDHHVYCDLNGRVHVILASYHCQLFRGTPRPIQVQSATWVDPRDFINYAFAAADLGIVADLKVKDLLR
jgi:8-oxo-dGTP diphosphatase